MAGRPKKYHINLTDEEFKSIKSIIRKKGTSKTLRTRCQIILDLDENHGKMYSYEQCYKSNGVCHATVSNTVKGYATKGMDYLTITCDTDNEASRKTIESLGATPLGKLERKVYLNAGQSYSHEKYNYRWDLNSGP